MSVNSTVPIKAAKEGETRFVVENGKLKLKIDLEKGEYSCSGEGFAELAGLKSAFRWNGREYDSGHYEIHKLKEPVQVEDGFGQGIQVTVIHSKEGLPELEQHFYAYENVPFVLLRTAVTGGEHFKANRLSVFKMNTLSFVDEQHPDDQLQVLRIPFDNDKWIRFHAEQLPISTESYEATTLFLPESRNGIVMGSLSHDLWKTGIRIKADTASQIDELDLYAGAVSEMTRDFQPHGYVKGPRVESPLVFLGFYEDYRSGLETYGWANTVIAPALPWEGGVPFGWNSWSAAATKLDYDLYTSTTDFLKQEVQPLGFENEGTLYINFDAFWNNLSPEEFKSAVERVRQNGHKPGTYWTPFAFWGKPEQFGQPVEGTDGKYVYSDILLRDADGEIVADIAGGLPIDPTHPGALARIDWFTSKAIADGFEYIKLDFMAHGALEGRHYNPDITTGIAAYRYGLSYLADKLSPKKAGKPFFIHLSIAPLFPYAFAHGRRISCDVFGEIGDTEYLLNSLTHGFWMNNTLYRFNDPDHTVMYKSFNQEPTTRHEGRSRLTASIISGTVLLLGDDFRREEAAWRAKNWLANREVLNLARLGQTFIPVEGNFGQQACDIFVLKVEETDSAGGEAMYAAVFNFDKQNAASKTFSLKRMGLEAGQSYQMTELWDGEAAIIKDELTCSLEPAESKIYKLTLAVQS
ncbi:alpha-galactosidase [Paenibacillus physcomitrellae]|uniref:Alpha-galactosidase n=1 Tax=Paenibacillus physcomitrellae TaxID=1619311 RepID=A0ABQ1FUU0_9BACL|nr:alpha-galactosidase [Paenibacillus physcomitrellae]GGA30199.1 alpha-galactosidase [Paenibacillus physcomitrellae]